VNLSTNFFQKMD